jgi:hypothetical protein
MKNRIIGFMAALITIIMVSGCIKIVPVPVQPPVVQPQPPVVQPQPPVEDSDEQVYKSLYEIYCVAYKKGQEPGVSCEDLKNHMYKTFANHENLNFRELAPFIVTLVNASCEAGQQGKSLMSYSIFKAGMKKILEQPTTP